jgi:exonuclease III
MRIIAINLNHRLANQGARRCFETWLQLFEPDLLLAQEPWLPSATSKPDPDGYRRVHTTPLLAAWVPLRCPEPKVRGESERWQIFFFQGLTVHHVYLSPHSSKERREFLIALSPRIPSEDTAIVLGDFNLAPRRQDGLFGDKSSSFTERSEREAFEALLESSGLVDPTATDGEPDFTFERWQLGKQIRFRCDLSLVSVSIRSRATVTYDHSVRAHNGFTDHSALIVDIVDTQATAGGTVTRPSAVCPESIRSTSRPTAHKGDAHKTAIRRTAASQIAQCLHQQGILVNLKVRSILDFGCGYGSDVLFYRSLALEADGYDVEPKFGWPRPEGLLFDLVTVVFVVNVLPSPEDRLLAVRDAATFARPGGHMLLAARSESVVATEARKGGWIAFNDGWISSPSRGTFQRGIPRGEIEWLLGIAGFEITDLNLHLSAAVSWLAGKKPNLP